MAVGLVLCALAATASAQSPRTRIPAVRSEVVERLPRGYPRPAATNARSTLQDALALQEASARTGDARLAARADAILATMPARTTSSALLQARAYGAQHRHDFDQSMRLLDSALALDPRDGGARLARAQLRLVVGRVSRARADCAALVLAVDSAYGRACMAAVLLRTGRLDDAARLADAGLAGAGTDAGFQRYLRVMRAEIASRAGAPDADRRFGEALVAAPGDVRVLSAYARHLARTGRHAAVVALLSDAPDVDGLLIRRALAAAALDAPDAGALADALRRRYATAHAAGTQPELRDEAEYLLTLRGDAQGALALAQRNFASQRDEEDVDLLLRAAAAARAPGALAGLRAWAAFERIPLPAVAR